MTVIPFVLPAKTRVSLVVYNIIGQQVAMLADEELTAGPHQIQWNGTDDSGKPLASGIYFYRLDTGPTAITKKMILLK